MTKIQIVYTILITLVIILCIALIQLYKQPIINQLNDWKLLPEPETFTELYFDNNLKLPSTITLNTPQTFSFTIHNEEYKTMTYPFKVYLATQSGEQLIALKSTTLNQNEFKTVKETFTVTKPVDRAEVIVNLISLNQQIDFWINSTSINPTPTTKLTKTYATKILPVKKKYGGWYWQPFVQKAFIWLGLDNLGQDIWGTGIPVKSKPKSNSSSSSRSSSSPTATPKPDVTLRPTIGPTQIVTPTLIQTPTPTGEQK